MSRVWAVVLLGGVLVGSALGLSATMGKRSATGVGVGRPAVRTYVALDANQPVVRYPLRRGDNLLKLRLRGTASATEAVFEARVGDASWQVRARLRPRSGVLAGELELSRAATRLLRAHASDHDQSLELSSATPLWIRAFTRRGGSWRRLAGRLPSGGTPPLATVREAEPSAVRSQQPASSSPRSESVRRDWRCWRVEDVLELPLSETVPAPMRLRVQALDGGELALSVVAGDAAFEIRELSPVARTLTVAAETPTVRIETLGRPVCVSLAVWTGPYAGAGLRAWNPVERPWRELRPSIARERIAIAEASAADAAPPERARYRSLSAIGAADEILAPRAGTGGLARLPPRATRVCAPDGSLDLRFRVGARRLGHPVQALVNNKVHLDQTVLATAFNVALTSLPARCFQLRIAGVGPNDLVLVDAKRAPSLTALRRRNVWELGPDRRVRVPVRAGEPQRITVTVTPALGSDLTVRVALDGAAAERAVGLGRGFSPPVVVRRLSGGERSDARVASRPATALAEPVRITTTLADDLTPGAHELWIEARGQGRAWVRASTRPLREEEL